MTRFVEVRAMPPAQVDTGVELALPEGMVLRFGLNASPAFVGAVVAAVRGRPC
jgi:hypothetical protein